MSDTQIPMIYQGTPYKNGQEASKARDEERRRQQAADKAEQPNNEPAKKG